MEIKKSGFMSQFHLLAREPRESYLTSLSSGFLTGENGFIMSVLTTSQNNYQYPVR